MTGKALTETKRYSSPAWKTNGSIGSSSNNQMRVLLRHRPLTSGRGHPQLTQHPADSTIHFPLLKQALFSTVDRMRRLVYAMNYGDKASQSYILTATLQCPQYAECYTPGTSSAAVFIVCVKNSRRIGWQPWRRSWFVLCSWTLGFLTDKTSRNEDGTMVQSPEWQ